MELIFVFCMAISMGSAIGAGISSTGDSSAIWVLWGILQIIAGVLGMVLYYLVVSPVLF